MSEIELLKNLLDKETQLSRKKMDLEYEKDDTEKLKIEIQNLEKEIDHLIENLKEHPKKNYSPLAHQHIMLQLNEHITALRDQKDYLNILKDQCMVIPNYYLGILLSDVHQFITEEANGYNGRSYLFYSGNPKECYDRKEMIHFLRNEVELVHKIEDINYISLRAYFEGFKKRLIEKFDH